MLTTVFLLAIASPAVSYRVADTVPIVTTEGLATNRLGLLSRTVTQGEPSPQNVIQVNVDGLRNDHGQVLCALYSSADGFPKKRDKALARAKSPISSGHAACEFREPTAGTYAVSVFHDENFNGKLDTNVLGIPREGVGTSNKPKGHFGPPKFDEAAFRFPGGRLVLKITINYL